MDQGKEKPGWQTGQGGKEPGKVTTINPVFNDSLIDLGNPGILKNHVSELLKVEEPIPHKQIIVELLKKVYPVDFRELASIKANENPTNAHYQIIAVEQLLTLAKRFNWGICRNHDFIYLFNGAFWSLVDKNDFVGFLGEIAEKMGVDHFKASDFRFRESLHKQFLALANLPKPETSKETVLINLKNGTFETTMQGTQLRPFDRNDFLTYQLPFEYNPKATAPRFERFINRVLPDKESQRIISEYLGYIFIHPSTLQLEKALMLYGTGANGKSVLFNIVNALLGNENVSSYSPQSLTNDNGYFRAALANKLVNYASEINGKLETSIFKQLVSGEPVEARLPYGAPFTLTNYAKLIFNVNELPRDIEHTTAYFRRFLIIPFDVTIPESEQNKELSKQIIENELAGVFNWVLEGLNRLLVQRNFSHCEAAKIQVEQYRKESDSVQTWFDENGFQPNPNNYKLIKDIYPAYRAFCQADGCKPVNKTNFIKRLRGMGILIEKKNAGIVACLSSETGSDAF